MKKTGFTLIELIVVITILAILGTIAFISFKGYTSQARNSKVTTDISNLNKSLSILKATKGVVPMPDTASKVVSGSTVITYEGEVGTNVRNTLKVSSEMKTPYGSNYKYAIDEKQKDFTLIGDLSVEQANLSTSVLASSSEKEKYFKGDDILTVFDSNDNFKDIDISSMVGTEKVYVGDKDVKLSGTSIPKSCKAIKNAGLDTGNGVYGVVLDGKPFKVYCDMTLEGGGWTLIYRTQEGSDSNLQNKICSNETGVCNGGLAPFATLIQDNVSELMFTNTNERKLTMKMTIADKTSPLVGLLTVDKGTYQTLPHYADNTDGGKSVYEAGDIISKGYITNVFYNPEYNYTSGLRIYGTNNGGFLMCSSDGGCGEGPITGINWRDKRNNYAGYYFSGNTKDGAAWFR